MVGFQIKLLLLCVMGVLSVCLSSQAGLTVEADPGDDVTLCCQHSLTSSGYLFWFKQTNGSVPVLVACKQYKLFDPSVSCYFFNEYEQMVMTVEGKNSSLIITAANHSDSGLYYCSFLQHNHMIFSNATYLQVKVQSSFTGRKKVVKSQKVKLRKEVKKSQNKVGKPDKARAGIATEAAEFLLVISNVAHACSYLMVLICALELRYTNKLNYAFEKIFLELENASDLFQETPMHPLMETHHPITPKDRCPHAD
ncbi:uncharacterized protein LOC118803033 [Colossoma macropomum]|uniref:uncharacterized protein LOC118803033 n=1 Tax=Colossoma macropomum TaxID=42526 RepID=UPI001864DBC7|nr:uncharacterized protein LOC118803033 [Colossoma macropomum]